MEIEEELNKDLILREKLAIQRTIMANQTTVLSFLRTSMYFLIAGLSLRNLFSITESAFLEIVFYVISGVLVVTGVINYWFQHTKIEEAKRHIGDYKLEYFSQTDSQKKKNK